MGPSGSPMGWGPPVAYELALPASTFWLSLFSSLFCIVEGNDVRGTFIELRLSETAVFEAGDEKVFLSWDLGTAVTCTS
jgi:hypothetical protein